MTVLYQASYSLPTNDQPLTHARIAHSLNWLSGGTAAASDTANGYFADAPLNSLTYEHWKPATLPATWAYDNQKEAWCDYCCIAGHTLGTYATVITLEYWNGTAWTAVISGRTVADDSPIFMIFAPITASQWRLSFSGTTLPKIATIRFGSALQMQRPLYGGHSPITLSRKTVLRSSKSETGEYLGRTKVRTYAQNSFSWQNLSASWVRAYWPTMQRAIESEPFWIAWRPELAPGANTESDWVIYDHTWSDAGRFWHDTEFWLDTSGSTPETVAKYGEVGYCQVAEVPVPVNQGVRDLMSVTLNATGLGYD